MCIHRGKMCDGCMDCYVEDEEIEESEEDEEDEEDC